MRGGLWLCGCFRASLRNEDEDADSSSRTSRSAAGRAAAVDDAVSMLPDDVLQMVLGYLSPSDVAVARLTCRHWRAVLGCYSSHLTLPTRFLSAPGARRVLRRTAKYFPSATKVTLYHADGWCDPVQARMDVEPLVRLERRSVSLEPLATGFSQLKQLEIVDATFTRDPWSLAQLAWLPRLTGLAVRWDTGLWAPGQVLQEAEALQPVFTLTQLTALALAKDAHLFLGEAPLGDAVLTAAAGLRGLVRLDLTAVSASDDAFAALAGLAGLTHLCLRGQLAVSLGALSKVFGATTRLHTLELAGLLPRNRDLRRIAAAHSGWGRPGGGGSSNGSGAGRRSGHAAVRASSSLQPPQQQHRQQASLQQVQRASPQQPQQQQQQVKRGSPGSWSSSHLWEQQAQNRQQQQQEAAIVPAPLRPGSSGARPRGQGAAGQQLGRRSDTSASTSPGLSKASSSGSTGASTPPRPPAAPLPAGGSSPRARVRGADWSAVLLPLRRLRVLRLQSDLVLLGSCSALRSMSHVTHVELHGGAKFLSAGPFVSLPPSWLAQLPREANAAAAAAASAAAAGASGGDGSGSGSSAAGFGGALLRPQGAWPGLVSLHVDNLQLADGFVEGVAQLASLRTLVVSGPCLLAMQQQPQPQQQPAAPAAAAAQLPPLPPPSPSPPQQQQVATAGSEGAGVLGLAAAAAAAGGSRHSSSTSLSSKSSSGEDLPPLEPSVAGALLQLPPGLLQLPPGLLQLPPGLLAAGPHHHQQQQRAPPLFQPLLDADVLTQLQPLSRLSRFELHLQQKLPCGLTMTPFALAHLAVTWSGLTSLCLQVPAPPPHPAGGGAAAEDMAAHNSSPAAQLFVSLGALTSLQHLRLTLSDRIGGQVYARTGGASQQPSPQPPPGPAPHPQQPHGPGAPAAAAAGAAERAAAAALADLSLSHGSSSAAAAVAGAVAALPWGQLPASLVSLSLAGFVGVQPECMQALAAAAPSLRHLRLLHSQVPTSLLWALGGCMPRLQTLVIKEDSLGGAGSSGVAAVAGRLTELRALCLTLEPCTDVSVLSRLVSLRYLLLDGRSNTELRGIKGLRALSQLRALTLPLLHLHHTCRTALSALQLALPSTHIVNVSRTFGQHHGCSWFRCFTTDERDWWAEPAQPWAWYPTLDIVP